MGSLCARMQCVSATNCHRNKQRHVKRPAVSPLCNLSTCPRAYSRGADQLPKLCVHASSGSIWTCNHALYCGRFVGQTPCNFGQGFDTASAFSATVQERVGPTARIEIDRSELSDRIFGHSTRSTHEKCERISTNSACSQDCHYRRRGKPWRSHVRSSQRCSWP
jgi:hypothetical protein